MQVTDVAADKVAAGSTGQLVLHSSRFILTACSNGREVTSSRRSCSRQGNCPWQKVNETLEPFLTESPAFSKASSATAVCCVPTLLVACYRKYSGLCIEGISKYLNNTSEYFHCLHLTCSKGLLFFSPSLWVFIQSSHHSEGTGQAANMF